jgi:hypothetical protein
MRSFPAVIRNLAFVALLCLLAAGCGGSSKHAQTTTAASAGFQSLRLCFRHQGYAITPESARIRGTAPRSFQFIAVWNLLNPNRIALAVTISKNTDGAKRANAWTRKSNAKVGKGAVHAPVVRFGRINVLWTNDPGAADKNAIYGCVRSAS